MARAVGKLKKSSVGSTMFGRLAETCAGVRWLWVFSAGAVAGVLPYLLARLVIYGYVIVPIYLGRSAPPGEEIAWFGSFMTAWGWPAIHLLLVILAASLVARKVGEATLTHGALVGLLSVTASQIVGLLYGPLLPGELAKFLLISVGGGLLGGASARAALIGREALLEASRDIGASRDAGDVAAAIGEHLAGPEVIWVALWRMSFPDKVGDLRREGAEVDQEHELAGTWMPWEHMERYPVPHLWTERAVGFVRSRNGASPVLVRRGDLSPEERAEWEQEGVRSALLLPLTAPGGEQVGLLAIASRSGRLPRRVRSYQTVAEQAALALRLIEQAREAGTLRERQRMAHEIHDTLAQGFTSIVMTLEAAEGALACSPQRMMDHLERARRTARENLTEARRLVQALKPGPLVETPLPEALGRLVRKWSEESSVEAEVRVDGEVRPLPAETETALLRAVQEALANIRKHARADRAVVTLSYVEEKVLLDVLDDGSGFEPGDPGEDRTRVDGSGYGLFAMRERARRLGGVLSVESEPGEGTALSVELPAPPASDRRERVES